MQKSFGSVPERNVFDSLPSQFAVARMPVRGQTIIVTNPADLPGGRDIPVCDLGSGGSVPSCQVSDRGVGVGDGFGSELSSMKVSSEIGSIDRFGTVPATKSSTRLNSAGTLVTNNSTGEGAGSS